MNEISRASVDDGFFVQVAVPSARKTQSLRLLLAQILDIEVSYAAANNGSFDSIFLHIHDGKVTAPSWVARVPM